MKVLKTTFPEKPILNIHNKEYDYTDSFQGVLSSKEGGITVDDIGKAFFASTPEWVGGLFILRNRIVSIFGLKTSAKIKNRQEQLDNFKFEPGERIGLFKVFNKMENEVVLGEDDKHLNFRISLLIENIKTDKTKQKITTTTTVVFNNWFGRVYFLPVKPFHKLIVSTMLESVIRELEKQRN